MTIIRKPLRERELLLSSDVADAIERLVNHSGMALPLPINKEKVIHELIQLVHLQSNGAIAPIGKMVRRALAQGFANQLTNSSVFAAGYQHYEKRAQLPVIPVTEFFFKVVFTNGDDVAMDLEAMSDYEIRQSLPKRRSPIRSDVAAGGELLRDDDGDVLHSGSIAGVIVFPPHNRSRLLRTWLERRANVASGQMTAVVDNLGHARPDATAVEHLREHVQTVRPSLRRALPQPKK